MKALPLLIFLFLFAGCQQNAPKQAFDADAPGRPYDTLAYKQKAEKIDAFFKRLQQNSGFNGAVLISKDEQVVYKNAFGWEDVVRKKDSLTTGSVFQLASVSKQFTAAAIMKLADEGLLSVDDSVQKFFPAFPYKGITVRLLLTHRSGLGNYTYFSEQFCDRYTPLSNADVVNMMISNHPPIYFFPDRRFDYSNTGYVLLAAIIEKVSKKPFKQYMEEEIFRKVGMMHTYVYDINKRDEFKHVEGHKAFGGQTRVSYLDGVTGDKGVYSTVEDLHLWDRVLYSDALFRPGLVDSMFVPGSKTLKGPFNYGFGWRTYKLNDGKILTYHGGWWNGYKSFFFRDVIHHNSVIILSNRENSGFRNLDELFDILYDRKPNPMRKYSVYLHHSPGF